MKRIMILLAFGLFVSQMSHAQINVNVNIGSQPLWGPVGYDYVDYYYLPDIETYYSIPRRQFVYMNNGQWVFSNSLPARYQGYDLYNGYKVVVSGPRPYLNFNSDKIKYTKYKGFKSQPVIKYSKDPKYRGADGNPHGIPPGQAKKQGKGKH